ncbi:MAG: hypothetical protein ABSF18_03970 [Gammaproteobacteria bacterium]|jgi:hypothetical protein
MPRSKFNQVMLPVAAVVNPFVAGTVNAFILEHLVKYINPDYKGTDTIYRAGFGISFCASALQSMAMLYYQKVKDQKESQSQQRNHSHGQEHEPESGYQSNHSHSHNHKCTDPIINHMMHIFGLYLYNFAFAVSGLYDALLNDEVPEDEQQRLIVCAVIAFGGLVYTFTEAKFHELFINEAEHDHGNMLNAMFDQLFTQVFSGDKTLLDRGKQFWIAWGGMGSHALAGYFASREATKALGLLFWGKYPSPLVQHVTASSLGVIGTIMQTGSELKGVQNCKGPRQTWYDIQTIEKIGGRYLLMLFIYAFSTLILFHVMPESLGLNEEITPEDAQTMERALRVLAFFIAFGVPDCVMSWTTVEGAVNFVKEQTGATRRPLLAGSADLRSGGTFALGADDSTAALLSPSSTPAINDGDKTEKYSCCC